MKYSGVDIDDFGRAIFCPNCGWNTMYNEDVSCRVCGMTIINKCADTPKVSAEGWDYIRPSCNTTLDGSSRYCINCGNKSTFYINDFLDSWKDERDTNFSEILITLNSKRIF